MAADLEKLRQLAGLEPLQQGPVTSAEPRPVPQWALQQAFASRFSIGGEEGRMAMFPDEYADKPIPSYVGKAAAPDAKISPAKAYLDPRAYWVERGGRAFIAGLTQMIPASMTLFAGLLDKMGADQAGEAVGEAGLSLDDWLTKYVAVENPTIFDHLASGFGSVASFWAPGLGVATAAGKVAAVSNLFSKVLGLGAMSALESAVEQAERQQELMREGMTPDEALKGSEQIFWQNLLLTTATNAVTWNPAGRIARDAIRRMAQAGKGAVSEAIQERAQAVIQDVAAGRGTWSDYWDPEKYQIETIVGAATGGVIGGVLPEGAKQTEKEDTKAPTEAQPFEAEDPAGFKPYEEPVLRRPSEVPGGPPVGQAQQAEPDAERAGGEPEAPVTRTNAPGSVGTTLVDKADYTTIQALGRLEDALEAELGERVDFATELSTYQQGVLAEMVEKAEDLNSQGKDQQAWEMADKTIEQAKVMRASTLKSRQSAKEDMAKDRAKEAKKKAQAEAAPEAAVTEAPKTPEPKTKVRTAAVETEGEVSGSPDQQIYRGTGRENKGDIYRFGNTPVVGDGAYYTTTEEGAREYGPNVEAAKTGDVVKNPLVIKSDSEWLDLMRESGWKMPDANERDASVQAEQAKEAADKVKKHITDLGHDGLIVTFPNQGKAVEYNPNNPASRSWRMIKDIFERPTVVAYGETVTSKPTPAKAAKGIVLMSVSDLTVEPEMLQKREIKIDNPESGTNEAKLAAIQAEFDPARLDPVVAWRDPADGKLKVIDGHHTLEAAKRNGITEVNVKEFTGTREEAIQEARELNDRVTVNDPFSRAATVRANRESGMPKKMVEMKARSLYKEQTSVILKLSHLNPKGKALSALKSLNEGSDEYGRTMQYAKWIGEARERFPSLTNQHEREMFDFLLENGNSPGLTTATSFISTVESRGVMGDFSGMESLNLKRATESKGAKLNYERKLAALDSDLRAAKAEKAAALKPFKQAVKDMEDRITNSTNPGEMNVLAENLNAAKKDLREAETRLKDKRPGKIADKIAAIEDDRTTLKQEWRAAQDALAGGGEKMLFSVSPDEQRSISEVNMQLKSRINPTVFEPIQRPQTIESELVENILRKFGRKTVWVNPDRLYSPINGWYDKGINKVFVNVRADMGSVPTAMHEVTHHMEQKHPDLWWDFYQTILDNLAPGAYAAFKERKGRYREDRIPGELAGDMMAEVASKDKFWRELKARNPRAFSAVVNKLLDVLKAIRGIFLRSDGYGGLEAYVKDFGAIERAAAKAFATMSEREFGTEPAPGPKGQGSLFSITPGESYMKEKLEEKKRKEKGIRDRWRREGPGGVGRLLYEKMVDQKTWLYVRTRNALKAMGKNWYEFDISKNPYYIQRMMLGWAKKAEWAINHGVYSWDGKTRMSDSFIQIVKKYGLAKDIESGEFGMFAVAARLKAMQEVLGDSFFGGQTQEQQDSLFNEGMSEQERAARAEFEQEMALYDEYAAKHPEWVDAVKDFSEFSNKTMKRLVQSGMISEKMYQKMVSKYDIYAPLFVLEKETPLAGKPAYEMNQLIPGLVRMDPMQGMIKNVYRLEMLNAQNYAKKAAADFVLRMTGGTPSLEGYGRRVVSSGKPLQDYVEKLKSAAALSGELDADTELALESVAKLYATAEFQNDNVISFMRDGEIEYWQFDPDIHAAYTGDSEFLNHPIIKIITHQTKVLRAGAVLTPEFMVRNQWRDFQSAAILATTLVKNPKDAFLLPARLIQAASLIAKKEDAYKDFIMSGAGYANMVSLDQPTLKKELEQVLLASGKEYRAQKFLQNPVKYSLHSHPLAILQTMSSAIENVTRLAVREKVISDLRAEGFSEEEASARATIQAREASTDFGRAGAYGKIINRFIPFFNASVQGHDKMIRTLARDPEARTAAWTKGFLMLTVPTMLLWAKNHDEEWYKEKPLWMKNHFWLFSHDGGKNVWMLPKPFDVGLLFASLPERFMDWLKDEDPKAMSSWLKTVKDDVIPNDISVIMGPMLASMNEARANYDNYRDTPIVKGYLQKVAPAEQYTASTSEFAKWVGDLGPGRGWSPLKIDHVIRGTFGGLGRWGADIASEIIMQADPKRKQRKPSSKLLYDQIPDWMPIIRGISRVGPTRYTRDQDDFYEQYEKSSEATNTLRFYAAAGMKEDYLEAYQEMGVDLELYESVRRFSEVLGNVSKEMRRIEYADPEVLSRDEKRAELDKLTVQSNNLVREYMKKLRQVDRDEIQRKIDAEVDRISREWDESRR